MNPTTELTHAHALAVIFKHLCERHPELFSIEIEYTGSGDSGQVESIHCNQEDRWAPGRPDLSAPDPLCASLDNALEEAAPAELLLQIEPTRPSWTSQKVPSFECLLDDLGWSAAFQHCPGFEINEGGQGSVILRKIDGPEATVEVTIDHENNIVTSESSSELFSF